MKPAGGILFGVAFWTIVRRLDHSAVRDYMIISAYGMLLLFTSSQPAGLVLSSFYPPFGLPTISYYALSSYLVVLGIYSGAISVAARCRFPAFHPKMVAENIDHVGGYRRVRKSKRIG